MCCFRMCGKKDLFRFLPIGQGDIKCQHVNSSLLFLSLLNFCFGLPMRPRILPTQTKNTLELTIIDNSIDINCLKKQSPFQVNNFGLFSIIYYNFGSAKFLLLHIPCRGTMLVPRDCCLCCRPHSLFSFSPFTFQIRFIRSIRRYK